MSHIANWSCPQCGGFSVSEKSSGLWLFCLCESAGLVAFVGAALLQPPLPIWSWVLLAAALLLASIALWHVFRGRVVLGCEKCGYVATVNLGNRTTDESPSNPTVERDARKSGARPSP